MVSSAHNSARNATGMASISVLRVPGQVDNSARAVTSVLPILSIKPGESPRLRGEDKAHIKRLAKTETPLPPILVDRRTMRVIDGMHRLIAASLKRQETIEVEFFDGPPEEAYLLAVKANVTHGFPLSHADRQAATARILTSHPNMSDRAIAEYAGLGTRAVATIRRSLGSVPQQHARVGRDGKVRPLDGSAGRRRAAKLIADSPQASLREVAKGAGVSPATVRDVRQRLARGEEPVPPRSLSAGAAEVPSAAPAQDGRSEPRRSGPALVPSRPQRNPAGMLDRLVKDPSLRHNEVGRQLLRLLQQTAADGDEWSRMAATVPPHCSSSIRYLAQRNAETWSTLAQELEKRAKITDPWECVGERSWIMESSAQPR